MTTNYFYNSTKSKFLEISGSDNKFFLQNLITNDIETCSSNNYLYSCLLTPQGKFLYDFFIFKVNDDFILEVHNNYFDKLLNKLQTYKLKSLVKLTKLSKLNSFVIFNDIEFNNNQVIIYAQDPRNNNIGKKIIINDSILLTKSNLIEINENDYHEILIKNKVPYTTTDMEENKSLLLENNFHNLNAISWNKGCYVGQEITARMKYRALIKKQIYNMKIISGQIEIGEIINKDGINIGKVISKQKKYIFCMLKIDLVKIYFLNKDILITDSEVALKFL